MPPKWVALLLLLAGCTAGRSPAVVPIKTAVASASGVRTDPGRPRNTLYRDEIETAKRAGLGHLFERLELEPVGDTDENGRVVSFSGFQIVKLRLARDWLAFDFSPGDLLTHINGVSVEHYSTWYEQFEALPKLDQIRVDLVRAGVPQTVVVHIVERTNAKSLPPPRPQTSAKAPPSKSN